MLYHCTYNTYSWSNVIQPNHRLLVPDGSSQGSYEIILDTNERMHGWIALQSGVGRISAVLLTEGALGLRQRVQSNLDQSGDGAALQRQWQVGCSGCAELKEVPSLFRCQHRLLATASPDRQGPMSLRIVNPLLPLVMLVLAVLVGGQIGELG